MGLGAGRRSVGVRKRGQGGGVGQVHLRLGSGHLEGGGRALRLGSATEQVMQAATLLLKHWHVFSFDGSFGTTKLIRHKINLRPGSRPINQRYRPINPSLEKDLRAQIDKWLKHKVIAKSQSPWNFGLVAAPKKNGKIRWCVDYRALNLITERDTHPIGNIEDNLARLSKSTVFSGIDGSGAFHVIELEEADKPKTAFATPWGSFHFLRMPFGLSGGPSTYARLVHLVLQGIPYSMALPYLDDTVIHSPTLKEHFSALDMVLAAHSKAGLKLQPDKCQLFRDNIEYLGHVVSKDGIRPMEDYLKIVRDWPIPNTRSKTRSFLGKIGYYRRFIKSFSSVARPIIDKLNQEGPKDHDEFQPSTEFITAFEDLKSRLLKAPILAYPCFQSDQPFILDTDWSQENNAIGAVLSQKQDGLERVIAYGAKRLTKSQAAYPSTKGELAAAIIFMRHWRYYLQHRKFILRIDNQALVWIRTMESPTGMQQRWLQTLANFDFSVQHRPGTSHGNADSLSRASHIQPAQPDVDISMGEIIFALQEQPTWTPQFIANAQRADPDIDEILGWVRRDTKPTSKMTSSLSRIGKIYAGLYDSLSVDDNMVLRYDLHAAMPSAQSSRVVILPQPLWKDAILQAHVASAHMAALQTVQRAQRYAYFPGMLYFATNLLKQCTECQVKTGVQKDQRHTLISTVTGYPFQKLSLDFVGPLPTSHNGNKYILTVKDTFSRWLEAFPVRAATAAVVVNKLEKRYFPATAYAIKCIAIVAPNSSATLSTMSPKYSVSVQRPHRHIIPRVIQLNALIEPWKTQLQLWLAIDNRTGRSTFHMYSLLCELRSADRLV